MDDSERLAHDLANAVTIALANVEGMSDGIVEPTAQRLEAVAESLRRARDLIAQLRARDARS